VIFNYTAEGKVLIFSFKETLWKRGRGLGVSKRKIDCKMKQLNPIADWLSAGHNNRSRSI